MITVEPPIRFQAKVIVWEKLGEIAEWCRFHSERSKRKTEMLKPKARPCEAFISQKAIDYLWPLDKDRFVMRSAFQSALRCYFVSQHNLRLTECQIGGTLMNAEIVRNPFLVPGNPLPWPETQEHSIKLACVARLETGEKGQDILLQVLARPPWRSRNLSVSFFGAGHNGQAVRELATRPALKNVDFPGFVSDVESIWKTHHALVLPSRTEGLPLALIEAMLCGRFGIVTNEGGSAEVVEEGRTGFIANAAKADEFDKAMERAWVVREQWESIGKAAGMAVRTMVPLDPVASFTAKLLGLVHSGSLSKATHYGVSASSDSLADRGPLGRRSSR